MLFPGVAGHHLADAKQSHWAFRAVIIIPRTCGALTMRWVLVH